VDHRSVRPLRKINKPSHRFTRDGGGVLLWPTFAWGRARLFAAKKRGDSCGEIPADDSYVRLPWRYVWRACSPDSESKGLRQRGVRGSLWTTILFAQDLRKGFPHALQRWCRTPSIPPAAANGGKTKGKTGRMLREARVKNGVITWLEVRI